MDWWRDRRIKNTATRSQNWIDGKFYGGLDPTSQMQIDILEKQKEEYLKGLQNQWQSFPLVKVADHLYLQED